MALVVVTATTLSRIVNRASPAQSCRIIGHSLRAANSSAAVHPSELSNLPQSVSKLIAPPVSAPHSRREVPLGGKRRSIVATPAGPQKFLG